MINAEQIRAARALLDWSTAELAKQSGMTVNGLNKIERGHVQAHRETMEKLQEIFERAGIEFLPNSGLRKKDNTLAVYEGPERFNDFSDFLYEHLKNYGGDVCVSTDDERLFARYRKNHELHRQRMKELVDSKKVTFRILASSSSFVSQYAHHRWREEQNAIPTSFYAFGNCLALISFVHTKPPYVVVIESGPLAEAYRQTFNVAWSHAKEPIQLSESKT